MPVAGFTKLRKHLFGRQAVFGTLVPAVRAYPFSGVPSVNLNWTDPEVDVGSLDPSAPPYRTAEDLSASLTDPALAYNNIPLIMAGFFGGADTPTSGAGAGRTWTHEPASTTVDDIDTFTYQFGDDVLTDWFQLGDGILEGFEISGPEGLGPLTASMTWRFASAASTGSTDSPVTGTVPTAGLSVETSSAIVYLKDGAIAIASDPADFGTSQITDALHSFTLRGSGDLDQKRFANGAQSFAIQQFGRASRVIEFEAVFAKTADTVGTGSEADAWMSDSAVNRFVQMTFTSTVEAETGVDYSWTFAMPLRYYTRDDGESGGNTTVTLMGRAFYDPTDFEGVFSSTVVNTLTGL